MNQSSNSLTFNGGKNIIKLVFQLALALLYSGVKQSDLFSFFKLNLRDKHGPT